MSAQAFQTKLRPWSGPLAVLVAIGLGYYIIDINYPGVSNGYDGISRSLGFFYTLGPALAGFSAWDMSRFRALLGQRGSTVDLWRTVLHRLAAPSLVAMLFVLLFMGLSGGLSTSQAWTGVLLTALLTFLWTFFGSTLGIYLPLVISLPIAVFVPWVLTAYPQALSDPAWRQMFGQAVGGCCAVDAMIDPVTIRSSTVTLGLLLMACLFLLQARFSDTAIRRGGAVTAAVLVLAALATGHTIGKSGNFMNTEPRPSNERACDDRVCVWPESDRSMVAINLRVADKLGVSAGTVLVDGEPRTDDELWMSEEQDPATVEEHLLIQLLGHSPELRSMVSCWVDDTGRPMSVADNAASALGSSELVPAATGHDGRYLAYNDLVDPTAWDRIADLINRDSGCPA
ncbi:hypothetical protein [uncultured Corynebacterium sp.]|uniref:hypothetical protein n=1 Tax=uncultured Corynebacterium sp. TaxID=159447 RepID=UPI0025E4D10B|nr:hypothetical protein [uncultured Corynebacterium sp.]